MKMPKAYHAAQRAAHQGERPLHLMYFVLVCWEAHGIYGIAAGACALVMAVGFGYESA